MGTGQGQGTLPSSDGQGESARKMKKQGKAIPSGEMSFKSSRRESLYMRAYKSDMLEYKV